MTSDNSTPCLPSIESTSILISNDGFRNVLPQQRMSRSLLCEKPYGSVLTPVQLTLKCYSQGNLAPATARGGSYTRRKRCYTARLMRPSGSCTKFERANALRFPAVKASYSWASSASSTSSSKSGRSRAASRDEVKEIVKKVRGVYLGEHPSLPSPALPSSKQKQRSPHIFSTTSPFNITTT